MYVLGNQIDIGTAFVPTDVVAGAVTGARIFVGDCAGILFVCCHNGASTDVIDFDLQEANASSGGTIRDLDILTEYWIKDEATLDNDEVWARVTQSAASEITNAGTASQQAMVAFQVESSSLSDGYAYLSVNVPDAGTNATMFACGLYIKYGLKYPRKPANMLAPLR